MTQTSLRRALLSLALLGAWALVATQLVPPLIIAAYEHRSLPVFNALIVNRVGHPVEEYLQYWRNITWLAGLWCVAIWAIPPLLRRLSSPDFFHRAVQPATPGTLGLIRSWSCGVLLMMTLWEDLASTALLPRDMVRPKGVLHLLHAVPGFESFMQNAWALSIFEHMTAGILFLGVIGLGTRVVVPAGALCYLVMAGILREYAWFYHTGLIPIYVLTVLAFTPCGDGWSVDRLIRIARNRPVPPRHVATPTYGWSRYAVWTVIAVPYVAAGLSKLYYGGGFAWVGAENMRWILLRTGLAMMEFDFEISPRLVAQPDALFIGLGCLGLLTELVFGLTLVSWWGRLVLPGMMVGVHVGILLLQNILFIDLILLLFVFYDFKPVTEAFRRWVGRGRQSTMAWSDPRMGKAETSVHRAGARFAVVITCFLLSWWVTHIEFYPFTTMKMFSNPNPRPGVVNYVRAIAHFEDGSSRRAAFEDWIGAMGDSRYRMMIGNAFGTPEERALCDEFLAASMHAANRTLENGYRIKGFEVQMWEWNFAAEPDDPAYGRIIRRYTYPAKPQSSE